MTLFVRPYITAHVNKPFSGFYLKPNEYAFTFCMIPQPTRTMSVTHGTGIRPPEIRGLVYYPGPIYTIHIIFNTLRPRQNGRHFPDDIFKWIFLNENVWISINISLKFVPMGPINNIPTLVQVMAWRRPGDKPLSEPMMVRSPTHICVTRPQWVNRIPSLIRC